MTSQADSEIDFERRLRGLEARLELLELEGTYALGWDSVDAEAWAALFAPDGVFEMAALDERRPAVRHQGPAALRKFCLETNRRFRGLHMLHLPTFTIDGDRADGSLHFQFESGRTTPEAQDISSVTGLYKVTYRLVEGRWRIEHRLERATSRNSSTFHPGFYGQA